MKPMSVFEFENELFMPNVCCIHDNQVRIYLTNPIFLLIQYYALSLLKILSGGNTNKLFIHTFESKLKTEIKTTALSIYDIALSHSFKLNKLLSVCGGGSTIDICSNFSYKSHTLFL